MLHKGDLGPALDEANHITVGIRPTAGELHDGHRLTLGAFGRAVGSSRENMGTIYIDDLDFDYRHLPHSLSPILHQNADSLFRDAKQVVREIDKFADLDLVRRVRILRMSDYLKELSSGLVNSELLYRLLRESRQVIGSHFKSLAGDRLPGYIRAVCPECNVTPRRIRSVTYKKSSMEGSCDYGDPKFKVDTSQGDTNWVIYFALANMRNILTARHTDRSMLNIMGGDYGLPWGTSGRPQSDRLADVHDALATGVPSHIYQGPILNRNGLKISKSSGDRAVGIPIETIFDMLDSNRSEIEITDFL